MSWRGKEEEEEQKWKRPFPLWAGPPGQGEGGNELRRGSLLWSVRHTEKMLEQCSLQQLLVFKFWELDEKIVRTCNFFLVQYNMYPSKLNLTVFGHTLFVPGGRGKMNLPLKFYEWLSYSFPSPRQCNIRQAVFNFNLYFRLCSFVLSHSWLFLRTFHVMLLFSCCSFKAQTATLSRF